MTFPPIQMLTREGCHLCDDALALLRQFGVEPEVVNIDQHPDLLQQYNTCVPVVLVDGKVRFRGRVNPVLLARLLRGQDERDASP